MDATEVGLESNSIVLGKHSGRHALQDALEQLGLQGRGRRAEPGVQALQGDRRQEEAGHRARPGGDRLRRDARERRGATSSAGSRSRRARDASRWRGSRVMLPSGEESVGEAIGRRSGRRDLRRDPGGDRNRRASCAQYEVEAVTGGDDALGEVTVMLRAARPAGQRPGRGDGHPRGIGPRLRPRALERPRGRRDPRGRGGHGRRRGGADPRPLRRRAVSASTSVRLSDGTRRR